MTDVFIGGFSGSRRQARRTADALAEYRGVDPADFSALSFAEAMDNPEKTEALIEKRRVFTHSAGIIATKSASLLELTAIAPPMPTVPLRLIARAGKKTAQLTLGSLRSVGRLRDVALFNGSQAGELLQHPVNNLRHLGAIATYDSIRTAADRSRNGVGVRLGFMTHDAFGFTPPDLSPVGGISGVAYATVSGEHDEFILHPQEVMEELDFHLDKS